ncbi:response regulator with CheY-like receiver domain and winged-helix DNA-binding domain [Pleurocapsa sp. PCC 7327]|uniref:response regulator transcription factor n=1 Tax=Pleurocapsa sp. PCC 7327 TaxID=118163 RepID=UPI00029F8745|nr:response regulator transcription factor [Pleurocapsa sp. PCC 7327]AFY78026.1 response regulator with CheY-like receiver domain and winged-helix DNA-binding domain [Pleurocapsa sp. PCC 7327]
MSSAASVLIIEDDASLCETVQLYIEREGLRCLTAASGETGIVQIQRFRPDLVVLDIMLPDRDGFQICQELRSTQCFMPILMLTARAEEDDRVRGLAMGADDYLTKPFSAKELVARIHALLRRAYSQGYRAVLSTQDVVIDREQRYAYLNGTQLDLRGREFDLLAQLANYPGRVYTREQLLERIWGYDFEGDARIVDVYIRKLREKLEIDPAHPSYIQTVWGIGYRFQGGDR